MWKVIKLRWSSEPFLIFAIVWDRIRYHGYCRYYYKRRFKYYGENITWGRDGLFRCIPSNVRIGGADKLEIYSDVQIDEFVYVQSHNLGEGIAIGASSRINSHVHIQAYSRIEIGEKVLIAPFAHVSSGNHGRGEVSVMDNPMEGSGVVKIGAGSWLGRNSHVLGGVHIGKMSVVGANAVVTKGLGGEGQVYIGVPDKVMPL